MARGSLENLRLGARQEGLGKDQGEIGLCEHSVAALH